MKRLALLIAVMAGSAAVATLLAVGYGVYVSLRGDAFNHEFASDLVALTIEGFHDETGRWPSAGEIEPLLDRNPAPWTLPPGARVTAVVLPRTADDGPGSRSIQVVLVDISSSVGHAGGYFPIDLRPRRLVWRTKMNFYSPLAVADALAAEVWEARRSGERDLLGVAHRYLESTKDVLGPHSFVEHLSIKLDARVMKVFGENRALLRAYPWSGPDAFNAGIASDVPVGASFEVQMPRHGH